MTMDCIYFTLLQHQIPWVLMHILVMIHNPVQYGIGGQEIRCNVQTKNSHDANIVSIDL